MADADQYTKYRMMWTDQVFDDARVSPMAQVIAYRIGKKFNRKHFSESGVLHAWPSYETLAKEARCTPKTVQRAVLLLKETGHLLTEGNGGRHCSLSYFANIRESDHSAISVNELHSNEISKGGQKCPPLEEKESEKVDIQSPKGGHLKPEKVDRSVLQISMKKSMKKSMSANARSSSFSRTSKNQKTDRPEPSTWMNIIEDVYSHEQ